jgi:hypothetical protein
MYAPGGRMPDLPHKRWPIHIDNDPWMVNADGDKRRVSRLMWQRLADYGFVDVFTRQPEFKIVCQYVVTGQLTIVLRATRFNHSRFVRFTYNNREAIARCVALEMGIGVPKWRRFR